MGIDLWAGLPICGLYDYYKTGWNVCLYSYAGSLEGPRMVRVFPRCSARWLAGHSTATTFQYPGDVKLLPELMDQGSKDGTTVFLFTTLFDY